MGESIWLEGAKRELEIKQAEVREDGLEGLPGGSGLEKPSERTAGSYAPKLNSRTQPRTFHTEN